MISVVWISYAACDTGHHLKKALNRIICSLIYHMQNERSYMHHSDAVWCRNYFVNYRAGQYIAILAIFCVWERRKGTVFISQMFQDNTTKQHRKQIPLNCRSPLSLPSPPSSKSKWQHQVQITPTCFSCVSFCYGSNPIQHFLCLQLLLMVPVDPLRCCQVPLPTH